MQLYRCCDMLQTVQERTRYRATDHIHVGNHWQMRHSLHPMDTVPAHGHMVYQRVISRVFCAPQMAQTARQQPKRKHLGSNLAIHAEPRVGVLYTWCQACSGVNNAKPKVIKQPVQLHTLCTRHVCVGPNCEWVLWLCTLYTAIAAKLGKVPKHAQYVL
jgi:hypothetical protein